MLAIRNKHDTHQGLINVINAPSLRTKINYDRKTTTNFVILLFLPHTVKNIALSFSIPFQYVLHNLIQKLFHQIIFFLKINFERSFIFVAKNFFLFTF